MSGKAIVPSAASRSSRSASPMLLSQKRNLESSIATISEALWGSGPGRSKAIGFMLGVLAGFSACSSDITLQRMDPRLTGLLVESRTDAESGVAASQGFVGRG